MIKTELNHMALTTKIRRENTKWLFLRSIGNYNEVQKMKGKILKTLIYFYQNAIHITCKHYYKKFRMSLQKIININGIKQNKKRN